MYILRSNPKGGRPIKPGHFPLHSDKEGNFGYLIGYDKDGDKFLIPLHLAEQIVAALGTRTNAFRSMVDKIKPKLPFKEWLFIKLFGRRQYNDLKEYYEDELEER